MAVGEMRGRGGCGGPGGKKKNFKKKSKRTKKTERWMVCASRTDGSRYRTRKKTERRDEREGKKRNQWRWSSSHTRRLFKR